MLLDNQRNVIKDYKKVQSSLRRHMKHLTNNINLMAVTLEMTYKSLEGGCSKVGTIYEVEG